MKTNPKRFKAMIAAMLLTCIAASAAQFSTPKHEFRSAWVATVWALDWPRNLATATVQSSDIIGASPEAQKAAIDVMLDAFKAANFNAVNFQVRSMCDAMYKSSIEPWSSYLTGRRGQDPGYDPLEYVVEACHKRGMECHAWVNPYRWSTGSEWNTPYDQELNNDGWLIAYGTTVILDPGQQRVIDRIVDICREIITNYDVDGILYDDYFYPNGITSDATADDYQEWKDSGTSMSIGDWRRDNVNRMVKAVYDMIQETRPDVRFGISPAGVAASSRTVADRYGVDPSPGSDWQYNGIFSDPLAWMSAHTIDYLSPQIYWHIGHSTANYALLAPWWNKVAAKFGRHMWISHGPYNYVGKNSYGSENPEPSTEPTGIMYDEFANQVEMMRNTNEDGAPGSIYYSAKYMYNLGAEESLAQYLRRVTYRRPALPPAMPWKDGYNPGLVQNIKFDGTMLTWDGYENVRYTVYAFPTTVAHSMFTRNIEYLLGLTYDTQFIIPADMREGYQYAICVLDRMGNEYDPVIFGDELEPLDTPVLIEPEDNSEPYVPFDFSWQPVQDATSYTVEIASDRSFENIVDRVSTTATSFSSATLKFNHGETHFWRIHACADQRADGVSESRLINPKTLHITEPYNGQQALPLDLTVRWVHPDNETVATVTIATNEDMTAVIFTGTSTNGELQVPQGHLRPGNKYYVTVAHNYKGLEQVAPMVMFQTDFDFPVFLTPTDGGILYGD
ncbi:MAG: family 10 glycosylhydrolase, partial [Muribaculaceae bacterium]|nr:family 10 glycosylhydrolase [Muribaculaceae bacterium]